MDRMLATGVGVGLFAGFLAGYFLASARGGDAIPAAPAPAIAAAPAAPAPSMPAPGTALPAQELQARIAAAERAVKTDPDNVGAWTDLGNYYFDTHQPQKSVEAYGKALALKPGNPDMLTDQGVMYRELKQTRKAVANFKRASQLDPRHQASLVNLGVVYAEDLKQPGEAAKVWNQVLAIDATTPQAAQARQALAQLGGQAKP
jgi:cytochrome c-type biogenesis protein CcmH/NrfG